MDLLNREVPHQWAKSHTIPVYKCKGDVLRSRVRTLAGISDEFGIRVRVDKRSALSPLLFEVVKQEAIKAARGEGLWDLLYADVLVITAESEKEAIRKFGVG